jgi:hypothetical protein
MISRRMCNQVARVLSVSTVDGSDKLYKTQLDVGGGETRQVWAPRLHSSTQRGSDSTELMAEGNLHKRHIETQHKLIMKHSQHDHISRSLMHAMNAYICLQYVAVGSQ